MNDALIVICVAGVVVMLGIAAIVMAVAALLQIDKPPQPKPKSRWSIEEYSDSGVYYIAYKGQITPYGHLNNLKWYEAETIINELQTAERKYGV